VIGQVTYDPFDHGHSTDRQHLFGDVFSERSEASTETTNEHYCEHVGSAVAGLT
jgi:hypothetical protein